MRFWTNCPVSTPLLKLNLVVSYHHDIRHASLNPSPLNNRRGDTKQTQSDPQKTIEISLVTRKHVSMLTFSVHGSTLQEIPASASAFAAGSVSEACRSVDVLRPRATSPTGTKVTASDRSAIWRARLLRPYETWRAARLV